MDDHTERWVKIDTKTDPDLRWAEEQNNINRALELEEVARVKRNLPKDKELLDIDKFVSHYGLKKENLTPSQIKDYEIKYYVRARGVKNTEDFVKWQEEVDSYNS